MLSNLTQRCSKGWKLASESRWQASGVHESSHYFSAASQKNSAVRRFSLGWHHYHYQNQVPRLHAEHWAEWGALLALFYVILTIILWCNTVIIATLGLTPRPLRNRGRSFQLRADWPHNQNAKCCVLLASATHALLLCNRVFIITGYTALGVS